MNRSATDGRAPAPVRYPKVAFSERAFYGVCRTITVGTSRVYYPGLVRHRERLPKSGPYIVAPVHRSYVDWLIVARVTHRRLCYLVKAEVWRSRAAGRLLEMLGAFPVERAGADREAMRHAIEVLARGEPLVIFPEGTRQHGERIGELREGAAYVALRAGVPIIPVAMSSMEKAMARGRRFPRPARTTLVIGEPILPEGLTETSGDRTRVSRRAIHEQTERLRAGLQATFDEACGRREAN